MNETGSGLWHWTAPRESIGAEVGSYYLESERALIDPMIPPEGLDWLEQHGAPEPAILTNRHDDRDAWRLHDAFGCTVHCIRPRARRGPKRTAIGRSVPDRRAPART